MKKKKLARLRYNMWFYFIAFAVFLVGLVWVFQILLFDSIYQQRKFDTLVETGTQLKSQIDIEGEVSDDDLNSWLSTAVSANEAGIFSYLAYFNGNDLVVETIYSGFTSSTNKPTNSSSENASGKTLNNELTQPQTLNDFIKIDNLQTDNSSNQSNSTNNSIRNKNDEIANTITDKEIVFDAIKRLADKNVSSDGKDYVCYKFTSPSSDESFYVYATAVNNSIISDSYLVLRTSQQALLDTIKIIQTQLVIVTVFVILIAFFMSWFISLKLSKPITEMGDTAKKWAAGDDNVVFVGDSYEELSELADTLNFAKDGISQTGILQRDLLANVSHDLKTPLTMIKAYAEMIRDLSGEIKEKRDVHTQVIIDEADRLAMLVNDILDLSKLQNGMSQINIERVNLSELCETVVYRFNDFAARAGYKIEKDIQVDLFVDCDEKKIEQVIYNLIGNSINYTGEDKTILVKLSKTSEGLMFESVDSGKGISEDKIKTIWEKYYRFSETHQRPIKGTGLGLSIVKTILESHRLKYGVVSKKDVGSNFFILFKEATDEKL